MDHDNYKILIVDDELNNRLIIEAYLLRLGYEVINAVNGVEALKVFDQVSPDLILLDVMMPGMDGFEVCRRLKADPVTRIIPVIFVTALDDRDSKIRGIDAGGDDFLAKPLDYLELQARIKSLIRVKKYYEQIQEMNQKLLANMKKAQSIQLSLMPKEFPELANIGFEVFYQPAEHVGGDYYNFFEIDQDHLCIYLADVTGHGLDAAMLTIFIKEKVAQFFNKTLDLSIRLSPQACTEYLDLMFKKEGFPYDIFITLFISILNHRNLELRYSSAGFFEFPYHFSSQGFNQLACSGSLITSFGEPGDYIEDVVFLHQGESILFYTDGLIEQATPCGNVFGTDRLIQCYDGQGQGMVEKVLQSLKSFCGKDTYDDDIILLNMYITNIS